MNRFKNWIVLIAFLLIGFLGRTRGQTTPSDVYTSLLGDWVGYDDTVLSGVVKHIPVEVMISRKKDSVQMDYTYSKHGQPDFSTATRFMKLDPIRSEMSLQWKDDLEKSKYKSKDLNEFARTGLGMFSATGSAAGPGGGKGMFVLNLDSKTMSYKWMSETTPGSYMTITTFSLHRIEQKSPLSKPLIEQP